MGGEGVLERTPSPPKPTSPKNFPTTLRPMELQTLAPALDGVWWDFLSVGYRYMILVIFFHEGLAIAINTFLNDLDRLFRSE